MDDPIDRMIVAQARKYLDSSAQVLSCWLELVEKHQVLGVVAVADSIEDVVLSHLLFPERNRLLEIVKELPLACSCVDFGYLLVDGGEQVVRLIPLHFDENLSFQCIELLEGHVVMKLLVIDL